MRKLRFTTNRNSKPVERVNAIMTRLSRDKYLTASEVKRILWKLVKKTAPGSPHIVAKYAISEDCQYVGMIKGRPPVCMGEDHYFATQRVMYNRRQTKDGSNELLLLSIILKNLK